jgi:hypothetical protein
MKQVDFQTYDDMQLLSPCNYTLPTISYYENVIIWVQKQYVIWSLFLNAYNRRW